MNDKGMVFNQNAKKIAFDDEHYEMMMSRYDFFMQNVKNRSNHYSNFDLEKQRAFNIRSKAFKKLDINESQKTDEEILKNEYDITAEISELVQTLRNEAGLSQKQLSEKTGISQANISKIENGHYIPSIDILKRIADALGKRLIVDFIDIDIQEED